MFDFLLKYNKKYQKELQTFECIQLDVSKEFIDKFLGYKGKWVYTQYLPIGYNSDIFKCFVWHLEYNYISCVFRNDKLILKRMKRST